jgi:hypothetical protein
MNDVRQLFETVSEDLPPGPYSVDAIIERGRRSSRRRQYARGVAMVGAAAAVATVVSVGIPVMQDLGSDPVRRAGVETGAKAPAVSVPPFTYTFSGYTVGGVRVSEPVQVTPGYERAWLSMGFLPLKPGSTDPDNQPNPVGSLTVYRPGAFDAAMVSSGTKVRIGDRTGYRVTLTDTTAPPESMGLRAAPPQEIRTPALAWQEADKSWVVLGQASVELTDDMMIRVAERFRPAAAGTPATLPFRFGYLPDGWELVSAGRRAQDDPLTSADSTVADAYVAKGLAFTGLRGKHDLDGVPGGNDTSASLHVSVSRRTSESARNTCSKADQSDAAWCTKDIPDSDFRVDVYDNTRQSSLDEVKKITEGLRFATVAKRGTWFTVPR